MILGSIVSNFVNMDSSDEELFNASPSCSRSITSLNLAMKQTIDEWNDLVQDPIKERDCNNCLVKDSSVKITRLPNAKIKNKQANAHSVKRKSRRKWKFGSYSRRKTSSKTFSTRQILEKGKPTTEVTMESLENEMDDNTYARLHEQSQEMEEESCVAIQQDVQVVQDAHENAESVTLSTDEAQIEEIDLCADETYVCARILPYKFHQKRNTTSSNDTTNAVTDYDFLSSSSSSSVVTTEHDSSIDLVYMSKRTYRSYILSENRERLRRMSRKLSKQGELNEWKSKRKRSSSESFEQPKSRRKHCRRISSDTSSDDASNEIAAESIMEMTGGDNRNDSHSSHEKMDQEKSRPNIQISREACITLTRLEQMDNVDVIKWRASRIKNALEIIESQSVKKQQLDKQKQVTLKRPENEIIPSDGCNLSEAQDIHEDLSQLSMVSSTPVEKHRPARLNDSLDMRKLRKKYKLFKKPRVLIIKLETLKNSSENGRYSATEIDRLTKKYINFVISSTSSSKPRESLFYGFSHLQRKNMTDVNVTRTEDDKTSYSLSGRQSVNKSFKQSDIDGNPIKDTQVVESNSNENALFKFAPTFNQNQCKSLSPKTLRRKNSNSPQKTLLEIWRNAFCTQKTAGKPQKNKFRAIRFCTVDISRRSLHFAKLAKEIGEREM